MREFHLASVVTSAGQITQIDNQDADPGISEQVLSHDGQVDPTAIWLLEGKPVINFTTQSIAQVLAAIGLTQLAIVSAEDGDPFDIYFQSSAEGGTRDTADCTKLSIADGMACINSIDVSEGGLAKAACTAYGRSTDGTTNPLAISDSVSLPTQTLTREAYTVGPVKINGTYIEGTTSVSLALNHTVVQGIYDGQPFPKHTYKLARAPVFTIRTKNLEAVSDLGLFAAQGATDSIIYLTKMLQNGFRVANATTQHIAMSIDDGVVIARKIGGSHGQPAEAELTFPTAYDGTNAIVSVNAASAISL